MEKQNQYPHTSRTFLTTKAVFTISIIVVLLTVLGIWLFGLGKHRTIFENSILSTSVLSVCFFLFLSIGLYNGIKLKDNVGKLTDKINLSNLPDFSPFGGKTNLLDVDDSFGGVVISILFWVLITFLIGIFIWVFGAILWSGIIVFIAMLYWIFFRALRFVFKNSNKCKGNLTKSMGYGLLYTILYNFWIYGIIFGAQYLIQ